MNTRNTASGKSKMPLRSCAASLIPRERTLRHPPSPPCPTTYRSGPAQYRELQPGATCQGERRDSSRRQLDICRAWLPESDHYGSKLFENGSVASTCLPTLHGAPFQQCDDASEKSPACPRNHRRACWRLPSVQALRQQLCLRCFESGAKVESNQSFM